MTFVLKPLQILLPLYGFSLSFISAKNMSRGERAAFYLLMKLIEKKSYSPTDYYTKESIGTVYDPSGMLAEFGIKHGDIIDENDFRALCAAFNPRTGEPLLKNSGDAHRAGTDFAFSPPKSFSALWAISNREIRRALEQFYRESVLKGLDFLNSHATTRTGAGGKDSITTKFAVVSFQHGANRDQHPHLHLHNSILNLSRTVDVKWRTIEPKSLFQWQTSADAIHQAELIAKLQQAFPGIKIVTTDNGHSFEIEGVDKGLVASWSKRSEAIKDAAAAEGISIDDAGGLDRMFYKTRNKKEMLPEDPHIGWSEYAEHEHGFGTEAADQLLSAPAITRPTLTQDDITDRLGSVLRKLTATESAIKENALLRSVVEEFYGDLNSEQILETFDKLKTGELRFNNADKVVRLGGFDGMDYYSTVSMQTVEQRLSELAEKLANDGKHAINPAHTEKAIADQSMLSAEQADVVRHALSVGSIKVVEGAAGSGKSTSALAIANAFKAAGYTLRGLASSWSAANVIGRDAQIDSRAASGFINAVLKGKIQLTKDDVLMIDEVGLLGSRESEILLSFAEKYGCKIILLGEEKQLSPVSAGPALSIIMEKAGAASIETIRRQRTPTQREMVAAFRVGETDTALQKLESESGLHFHATKKSTLNAMVQDWADYTHQNPGKSTLLLAVKNADVRQINSQVRAILRKRGDITGPDITLDTPAPNASTKAAKFAVGEHVIFKKNDIKDLDVKNNDKARITDIRPSANGGYDIKLKHEDGRDIELNTLKYVDPESGGVSLSHAHAVTQWSAQGSTVDKSFVFATGMDRRYAYVGMSRHRDSASLYVDESELKSKLETAGKPVNRETMMIQLATQLARKSDKLSTLDFQDNRIGQRVALKNQEAQQLIERMQQSFKDAPLANITGTLERIKREAEAIEQAAKRAAKEQLKQAENNSNTLRI